MVNTRSKMFQKLKNHEYRKLFIASQIKNGLSFQIRALRQARGMTQQELAELTGTKQSVISRIENKRADNLGIQTLLTIAQAFDVAVIVRFEPIDKLIDWADNLSPKAMAPEKSEKILAEIEKAGFNKVIETDFTNQPRIAIASTGTSSPTTSLKIVAGTGKKLPESQRGLFPALVQEEPIQIDFVSATDCGGDLQESSDSTIKNANYRSVANGR